VGVVLLSSLSLMPRLTALAGDGPGSASTSPVQWSEKDAQELAATLHLMHEQANRGDMEAVKKRLIGDDVLVTFELAADNKTAVPLRGKKAVDLFLDNVVKTAADENGTFYLEMPKMSTRATATWGVVTEECTVRYRLPSGSERVDKLFGTNIAVKTPEGWKFIQWHMSVASPSQDGKDAKTPTKGTHAAPGHGAASKHP
jgi:hypothetical protein